MLYQHFKIFYQSVNLRLQRFKKSMPSFLYLIKWTLISILLGLCIGSASAGFLISLEWVTQYREIHPVMLAGLPAAGFLIGLLYHYTGKKSEGGNNLLIDTIHQPKVVLPFIMAPLVFVGTLITHLFGGSAGREGTALQMAGALADQFSKPLRLKSEDRKILLIAAAAAGFGSVFGTPLAGALFGMEFFLIGRLKYNALYPAFAAAICADIVTKAWSVTHVHYSVGILPSLSLYNGIFVLIAAVIFGIVAWIFSKTLHGTSTFFKKNIQYPPLRPFVGGFFILLLIGCMNTTKYVGLGLPVITDAFHTSSLSYDFALKMLFTIITLGSGFKGGEVTPLFFIGATLGSALSLLLPLPVGLLAGMGFVAVFAGATNTPLACSLMAIELFGLESGVFMAIGCIVAYLFSGNTSIYQNQKIGEPKHPFSRLHIGKRINEL